MSPERTPTSGETARILIVEDESLVALDIRKTLERHGYAVVGVESSGEAALRRLEQQPADLVLMDIKLAGALDGIQTAYHVRSTFDTPVILLTAFADDATLERAKRSEPFAYLLKPFTERELRTTIVIALYRHQAEARIAERERLFSTTLRSISDAVIVTDADDRIDYLNPVAEEMFGINLNDARGFPRSDLYNITTDNTRVGGQIYLDCQGCNGALPVEITESALAGSARGGYVIVIRDLSERIQVQQELELSQDRLRKAQKMEAIGQLSGGIAHDFNNLLTVILGYTRLMSDYLESGEAADTQRILSDVQGIRDAVKRSMSLTRQLLAFSRQQSLKPERVSVNAIVDDTRKMIRRVISETIEIRVELAAARPGVRVDRVQMEQVLLNLVVNARDAMESGGQLIVRTTNRSIDEAMDAATGEIPPGRYVVLSVSDTGAGVAEEHLGRLFEPFFTTKDMGHGTGLGLATVYGIVTQSGGQLTVDSEPGVGSVFSVYLPEVELESEEVEEEPTDVPAGSGHETVLVVEDDPQVLPVIVRTLASLGYHVLSSTNPGEALLIAEEQLHDISLLVCDVMLPRLSGPDMAGRMRERNPDLNVLFMSAHPFHVLVERGMLDQQCAFMQKPFEPNELAAEVRTRLDAAE